MGTMKGHLEKTALSKFDGWIVAGPETKKEMHKRIESKFWLCAALLLAGLVMSGCAMTPAAKEARFLTAGKKDLEKKNYARAAIQFQNAARAKKGDSEPYYQLALAYIGMG